MTPSSAELAELRTLLQRLRGATAIRWTYTASHRVLHVRFLRPDIRGNTHLVCEGCGWLEGPDGWRDADLTVEANTSDSRPGALLVQDHAAGFSVICGRLYLLDDVPPVH